VLTKISVELIINLEIDPTSTSGEACLWQELSRVDEVRFMISRVNPRGEPDSPGLTLEG